MPTLIRSDASPRRAAGYRRNISAVLAPLDALAARSPSLTARHDISFESDGTACAIPRYLFVGPAGGAEPIRVGLFAGIHGDEPEGVHALVQFLRLLDQRPDLARGYCLFVYPVCNPTGFEDNTRHSRRGKDLNREFWKQSSEPEVRLLQAELVARSLHGLIALHTDDTSEGFYGFVQGATLTESLLKPALAAAGKVLGLNQNAVIDGFQAREGIIRKTYDGVLSAPPKVRPRPFEVILETPASPPSSLKEAALVMAMQTILNEYRKVMAYAANL